MKKEIMKAMKKDYSEGYRERNNEDYEDYNEGYEERNNEDYEDYDKGYEERL